MIIRKTTFAVCILLAAFLFVFANPSAILAASQWVDMGEVNRGKKNLSGHQNAGDGIVYVSDSNGDDAYDGSIENPKKTIQAGITLADSLYAAAEVHVAEGTYLLAGNPIILKEGISLYGGYSSDWSARHPSLYTTTVTDDRSTGGCSGHPNYAVYADGNTTSSTRLDGFTINAAGGKCSTGILSLGSPTISNNVINGGTVSDASYCIYLKDGASPRITNNRLNGGSSDDRSFGIYAGQSTRAIISYNIISGGNTLNGTAHAIYGKSAASTIENNSIYGGHCATDQGYSCGIREASGSNSMIANNTIDGGTGYRAYGIVTSDGSNPEILNNTINAGSPPQTAIGIYIKNDDNPRIINNLIFTSGGLARYGIYENDPGDFPGHANPDSNPGILRNNNIFDCPTALISWFNEHNTSWHAVNDLYTPITTAEDGEGTMADWDNISEDISGDLDSEFRFAGNLDSTTFDSGGRNGAHSNYNWHFSIDKDGNSRSPLDNSDTTGWSMGAYEYDSNSPPPAKEDINQDGHVDSLDLQLCINVFLGMEQNPIIVHRADVNQDEQVNEADIYQVVQKILGG